MGGRKFDFLRVFPERWTLLHSGAESCDSFATWKLRILNASPSLQLGRGNRYLHGQGAAKHFMQEVLVAVLLEDDLTVSGRRVSKMSSRTLGSGRPGSESGWQS
jgi:hypothetical protein